VVWELKKRLFSVLAEPYKKRLEQFLIPGCVCDLSEEDLTKDNVYLGSKIAKSLAFE
jgi:hypothetical protein